MSEATRGPRGKEIQCILLTVQLWGRRILTFLLEAFGLSCFFKLPSQPGLHFLPEHIENDDLKDLCARASIK